MKKLGAIILILAAVVSLFIQYAGAAQPHKVLQKNPFIKPSNTVLKSINDEEDSGDQTLGEKMVLRATLTSDANSIANINGEMLTVGESINGYELIKVNIGSAVLTKNGKQELIAVNEKYESIK